MSLVVEALWKTKKFKTMSSQQAVLMIWTDVYRNLLPVIRFLWHFPNFIWKVWIFGYFTDLLERPNGANESIHVQNAKNYYKSCLNEGNYVFHDI